MYRYFANPWMLCLLAMVPFVLWRWLRRPRRALRFSDTALLTTLPRGRAPWASRVGIACRAIALTAIVLALAGLRWPDRGSRIPTEGIAVMILVDVSGSMGETDFDWPGEAPPISRLEAVKRAFRLFVQGGTTPDGERLDGRPDDLVGLVPFAARPGTEECPLTLSHSVVLRLLDEMQPLTIPGDSETNISDALVVGLQRLRAENPRQRKVMILLSDGEHNVEKPASEIKPRQAANLAGSLGIPVYTIDAGTESADPGDAPPESANTRAKGIRTLQDVANITKGQYFQARDSKSLLEVCRRIDGLERQPIESFQYRRYYEAFPWLGFLAFSLWLTVTMLELTRWQRLP